MDNMIFVVDESDRPLAPVPRTQAINRGLWRRASGILITNPNFDQIICHRRTSTKDERPSVWVSMFGGKCDPGETPEQTVLRELKEESSIIFNEHQPHFFAKVKSVKHHQFEYLYWAPWSGDIQALLYDPDEVEEIKWLGTADVYKNLSEGTLDWYCYDPEELAMIRHIQSLAR